MASSCSGACASLPRTPGGGSGTQVAGGEGRARKRAWKAAAAQSALRGGGARPLPSPARSGLRRRRGLPEGSQGGPARSRLRGGNLQN